MSATLSFFDRNVKNAQFSTGPRTEQGKAASSRNAETHGLTANLISPHDAEGLALQKEKYETLAADYKPDSALERELLETAATARVKMIRIERRQSYVEERQGFESNAYPLLQRYLRDAERAFHRALKTLADLSRLKNAETRTRVAEQSSPRHREQELASIAFESRRDETNPAPSFQSILETMPPPITPTGSTRAEGSK